MTKERKERQSRAIELWNEGKNVNEISDIMGLAYQTVRDYVCEMPDWESRKRASNKDKIEDMIIAGYSNPEIAEALGVHKKTVCIYRSKLNSENSEGHKEKYAIPPDFSWKWAVTVNRLLKAAGKTTQPVPEHDADEEKKWFSDGRKPRNKRRMRV